MVDIKTMDARTYLERIEMLDLMIENKLNEKKMWLEISQGTTAQMGGERVQSSGSKQKMADAVNRCVDLDAEIEECRQAKRDIIATLEQLKPSHYNVLYKRYVLQMQFKEIDIACKKGEGWATTIHGRALKNVQRLLDEQHTDKGFSRV